MRRDQEIAETQRDMMGSENIRLKQKVRNLESSLEQSKTALAELEAMKAKPQVTSEQHKQLMDQVNQLNILRESNSVLRDEKTRIKNELDQASKAIKELERQIEPLKRKESDSKTMMANKELEIQQIHTQHAETLAKSKADHIQQIKQLNANRISSDNLKKVVADRDNVSFLLHKLWNQIYSCTETN